MFSRRKKTAMLNGDNPLLKRVIDKQSETITGTIIFQETREILFIIRGMIERATISPNDIIKLGRFEYSAKNNEIDLTPYGANKRGVSRTHAQVHMIGDKIYIVDLDSTNGTFLRSERLIPNTPSPLQKGNDILLGRLQIKILFR